MLSLDAFNILRKQLQDALQTLYINHAAEHGYDANTIGSRQKDSIIYPLETIDTLSDFKASLSQNPLVLQEVAGLNPEQQKDKIKDISRRLIEVETLCLSADPKGDFLTAIDRNTNNAAYLAFMLSSPESLSGERNENNKQFLTSRFDDFIRLLDIPNVSFDDLFNSRRLELLLDNSEMLTEKQQEGEHNEPSFLLDHEDLLHENGARVRFFLKASSNFRQNLPNHPSLLAKIQTSSETLVTQYKSEGMALKESLPPQAIEYIYTHCSAEVVTWIASNVRIIGPVDEHTTIPCKYKTDENLYRSITDLTLTNQGDLLEALKDRYPYENNSREILSSQDFSYLIAIHRELKKKPEKRQIFSDYADEANDPLLNLEQLCTKLDISTDILQLTAPAASKQYGKTASSQSTLQSDDDMEQMLKDKERRANNLLWKSVLGPGFSALGGAVMLSTLGALAPQLSTLVAANPVIGGILVGLILAIGALLIAGGAVASRAGKTGKTFIECLSVNNADEKSDSKALEAN